MGIYTIFYMFENPRTCRQARNLTTKISKILDLKSSSEQIFSENCRWVPLTWNKCSYQCYAGGLGASQKAKEEHEFTITWQNLFSENKWNISWNMFTSTSTKGIDGLLKGRNLRRLILRFVPPSSEYIQNGRTPVAKLPAFKILVPFRC